MSIIATLDVPLRGDTSNIDAALARTEGRVKQFAGQATEGVNKTTSGIKTATSNAASGFGSIGSAITALLGKLPGFGLIQQALGKMAGAWSAAGSSAAAAGGQAASAGGASLRSGGMLVALGGVVAGAFAAAAAAIAGAIAAVGTLASQGISAMGQLGREAGRLGVTTTALAGLQHGAALAGVSAEELTHYLTRFQKSLSEVASGGGAEARKALAQLGLQIEDIQDLAPDQAFARFAEALKGTGSAADKIRIADAIMGKGADQLIPFLSQGAEGIARMTKEAAELGPVGQASVESVRQVGAAWRQFSEATAGIGRSLAVIFAPVLTEVAQGFSTIGKSMAKWLSDAANMQFVKEILKAVWDACTLVGQAFVEVGKAILDIAGELGMSMGSWEEWREGILRIIFGAQTVFEKLKAAWQIVVQGMTVTFKEFINAFIEGWNYATGDDKPLWNVNKNIEAMKAAWGTLSKSFSDAINEKMAAFNKAVNQAKAAVDQQQDKGKDIASVSKGPAAVLAGSKEAFEILYGGDREWGPKMAAGVDQLVRNQNPKMLDVLQKILDNMAPGKGLRAADLGGG